MIDIQFFPGEFKLDITGHSNYDDKGKDIVCAAVSSLFYALAHTLTDCDEIIEPESLYISDKDGEGHIACRPKTGYEANLSLLFLPIITGLQLVAANYKKYAQIKVSGVESTTHSEV